MRRPLVGALGLAIVASIEGGACGNNSATSLNGGRDGSVDDSSADGNSTKDASSRNEASSRDSSRESSSGDAGVDGGIAVGDSVLTHHKNINRDGMYVQPSFTKSAIAGLKQDTAFRAFLPDPNDHVYAQPLFVDGRGSGKDLLIVATEANNVYALDATTGAQIWVKNLGKPVPLSAMSCGNIDPFGVTGTPVIDYVSRTIFVDALLLEATPMHMVFALSIDSGATKSGWPVKVDAVARTTTQAFHDTTTGERGALLIVGETLYVPFGGLNGQSLQRLGARD